MGSSRRWPSDSCRAHERLARVPCRLCQQLDPGLTVRRDAMHEADPARRLGRGETVEVEIGCRRAFGERGRFRKKRQPGAVRDEARKGGEGARTPPDLLQTPHRARSQDLVAEAVTLGEREQGADVGLREVFHARGVAKGTECVQPLRPAGNEKAVLEEVLFGDFHQSERKRDDRDIEMTREKRRNELAARPLEDVELDFRSRFLEMREKLGEEIWRQRRDDTGGDAKRARVETLNHGLQHERLVENPERLLVDFPPEYGQQHATALALEERRADGVFELPDLQ